MLGKGGRMGTAYSYFEIHHFLCKSAHFVVKAELIFARFLGREDRVQLALFGVRHDCSVWAIDTVIDIEGATGLDLQS